MVASKRSLEEQVGSAVMEFLAGEPASANPGRRGGSGADPVRRTPDRCGYSKEAASRAQVMRGLVYQQEVPLYPGGKKELLKDFKQGCDKVRFVF